MMSGPAFPAAGTKKDVHPKMDAFLVDANGLEPLTPCTSSRCSSQLS